MFQNNWPALKRPQCSAYLDDMSLSCKTLFELQIRIVPFLDVRNKAIGLPQDQLPDSDWGMMA